MNAKPGLSNSQQQCSNASGLRNTLHGIIYQVKLLVLFLQSALEQNYEFKLYSEKDDVDKFDNVIFQYGKEGQYRFLTTKHKSSLENKISINELRDDVKKPFNLIKYFNSFRKIERQPHYREKIKDLIICTNTDFEDDIKVDSSPQKRLTREEEHDDILNIGGGKRYKLIFDKNSDIFQMLKDTYHKNTSGHKARRKITGDQIVSDSDIDKEIKRFFEKLVFAVEQPGVDKLSELIQEKTFRCLDGLKNDVQAELICDYVEQKILDWLKKPESIALSRKDDFFKEGQEKIKEIMFHASHLEYSSCIKGLNINFNSECQEIRELTKFFDSEYKILNIISSETNISISQVKIYQIKQQQSWRIKDLINLTKYTSYNVENLFNDNFLIFVCLNEDQSEYEEMLHQQIIDAIKDNNKKIIMITQSDSILPELFKKNGFKDNYKEISDMIRIEDLDSKSLQDNFLKKTIIFQGQEIELSHLMNIESDKLNNFNHQIEEIRKLKTVMKTGVLSELVSNTIPVVGSKLPDFSDIESPYYDTCHIDISRTFSHQIIDTFSLRMCIEEQREDIFVFVRDCVAENILFSIGKIEIKDFNKRNDIPDDNFFGGRFFILSDKNSESDFDELCNNNKGKSIHWIKCIDNNKCIDNKKFTVKYSNKLSNLRKFVKMEYFGKKIESHTVAIIFGTAGIGKSTMLTTYSQNIDRHTWSIRINLKDHQEHLKNANLEKLDTILEFLYKCDVGLETSLAKGLLKYYLIECKKNIILLLDGYDEIDNESQEKVIRLLKFFENMEIEIWLTSRLSEQQNIENALGSFAFSYFLNPFDEKEQNDFLTQYWMKELKVEQSDVKEKGCIEEFTTELLKHFHKLGLMKGDSLIGIVLQARMITEIFHPKLKFNSSKVDIHNVSDLYEKFIKHQYKRYFTEKVNIDINLLGESSRDSLIDKYTKAHGFVALNVLFPKDKLRYDLLKNQEYNRSFQHELTGIGIIKSFKDDYVGDFIHYTYAEYFVAKLSINLFDRDVDFKPIRTFLFKNLSLSRNRLIRIFLEYEIQKISNRKIKNKWEVIKFFLGKTEIKKGLFFHLKFIGDSNTTESYYNVLSNKTLNDLTKDVKKYVSVCPEDSRPTQQYRFIGDINLMEQLFRKYFQTKNIEELQITLRLLIEIKTFTECDLESDLHSYLELQLKFMYHQYNAFLHYLTQCKLENKSNPDFERYVLTFVHHREYFTNFTRMLSMLNESKSDEIRKKEHFVCIAELLIHSHDSVRDDFVKLNNIVYHLFNVFDQSAIQYINSDEDVQKIYGNKIFTFLRSIKSINDIYILKEVLEDMNIKYIQFFVTKIVHHENMISDATLFVNELFLSNQNDILWLQSVGVLISRFLKIFTFEMSQVFTSIVQNIANLDNKERVYISSVLYDLIICIIHTLEMEKLPQIDKTSFLTMTVYFVIIFESFQDFLPFTYNNLKTMVNLLQEILNQQNVSNWVIFNIACYLCALKKAKIEIIALADKKILLQDPSIEFKSELSSIDDNRMHAIIEHLNCYKELIEQYEYYNQLRNL